jgi:hypothetical protein
MFLAEPHRTTRTYRALLANVGKEIFGPAHQLEPYYAAAYALYRLEFLFRNQALDPKFKPARYHILLAARLIVDRTPPPKPVSHEARRFGERVYSALGEQIAAEALLRQAAAVVDQVAGGSFDRDSIRTEGTTQSLLQEFGVHR